MTSDVDDQAAPDLPTSGRDFITRLGRAIQIMEKMVAAWPTDEQGRPLVSEQARAANADVVSEIEQITVQLAPVFTATSKERLFNRATGEDEAELNDLFERLAWMVGLLLQRSQGVGAGKAIQPVPFTPDTITFLNDPHTLAAIRAMWAGPQAWQQSEHHQPYYQDKNGVTVYAQEGTHFNPQALDAAWRRVLSLDDSKVNTFLICIGKWMADTGGDARAITKTRVDVADILGFRGVKKHHKGGYRRDQKEDARSDILTLNSIWVRSRDTVRDARGKPKEVQVESRLLEVAIESQQDFAGGFEPYAFRIAPGEWALHYLGPHSRKTAELLRPVMQYDPDKQRLAMRLGIYLASQWRIRAATENYAQPWAVRTLLQGAFIELPTANYDRFRQQVENALDQLHTDRVITGWEYVGDTALPLRKWFDQWLDWRVCISPPLTSVERYAELGPRRRRAITRSKQAAAAARQRKGKA